MIIDFQWEQFNLIDNFKNSLGQVWFYLELCRPKNFRIIYQRKLSALKYLLVRMIDSLAWLILCMHGWFSHKAFQSMVDLHTHTHILILVVTHHTVLNATLFYIFPSNLLLPLLTLAWGAPSQTKKFTSKYSLTLQFKLLFLQ